MLKKHSIFILAFIIICILLPPRFLVSAQSETYIVIDRIDTTNFPETDIYFSILDHQGFPIPDLINDNIQLSEDGQVVSNFELTPLYQHPIEIVLVVDTSATMGFGDEPTPIRNLQAAAKDFVNTLSPNDQVALITISDDAYLIQDLTSDKNTILLALDNLAAEGDSLINDGIMEAILALKGSTTRPVIVILMDGMDSGLSEFTLEEISNHLIQQRIPIYIISWRDANQDELEKLTALVHGDLQFLPDYFPDENAFQASFNNLSDSLVGARGQYLLSYASGLPADGIEHEAVLAVDLMNRHAETTRHFSAEPGIVNIDLLNLTENQMVSGNVKIIPDVSAPAEVEKIDIALDGVALTNVLIPPYEYTWDSTTVDPGTHKITVIATDRVGNKGQADINLIVEEPISIQITEPMDGSTVSGSTMILTDITSYLDVERVELFVDSVLQQTIESEPYGFDWDLSTVTAGSHKISVSATDIDGFSAEDEINVEVVPAGGGNGWIIVIAAIGAAAILIPIGLRARRKRASQQAGAGAVAAGSVVDQSPGTSQVTLRELQGLNPNQIWSLGNNEVRLGRKRSINDIPLMGRKASREQGLIQYDQGQFVLHSLNLDNPMLVNDYPVARQVLQSGDLIRGGESTFRFEIQGS
ncbi:Ig-like domain-containing protein [Chloroflexota bacterium]